MALKNVSYRLKSLSPLMMHNGQLADPLNKFTKALKSVTSKRKKTDSDLEEMARLEFLGSLYMSASGPAIPADNITSMVIAAAKKHREGDLAKTGVFCEDHATVEYEGPRDTDGLWNDERFRDARLVRVQAARIVRTRPVFPEWETTITLAIDDELVNQSRVDDWMQTAGRIVGLLEMRPRLGRFTVERIN